MLAARISYTVPIFGREMFVNEVGVFKIAVKQMIIPTTIVSKFLMTM
jgi:hypothetical protein